MSKTKISKGYKVYFDREKFKQVFPFSYNFLYIDGCQMHYIDEGAGETILMVHGNPTWSFYYRNLISYFNKTYRVVAPDHIGYGLSEKPKNYNYTLEQHIQNLEEFVQKLNLKDITLVMHDWGGPIGMGFAVRNPKKIKRLIICNTGAFRIPEEIQKHKPWQLMIIRIPLFGNILVRVFNAFSIFAILWAICHKERRTPETKAGLKAPYNNYANRVAVLRAVQDIPLSEKDPVHMALWEIEKKLSVFKNTPKILFWGCKDFVFNHICLRKWFDFYPDAEVHQFEDAGHYVIEDAYERIIPKIDEFLNKNPI
ncbi:MAG: alpha/beta fold hydrolase [Promethearchaeota archaeon]